MLLTNYVKESLKDKSLKISHTYLVKFLPH